MNFSLPGKGGARYLYKIFAVAAVFHLAVFFGVSGILSLHGGSIVNLIADQDQNQYMQLAYSLYENKEFELRSGLPETFRTPGYPFFALVILLFTGGSYFAVYVAHALLMGLSAAGIAYIGERLGMPRFYAIIAASLFTLSSGAILVTLTGMGSDILYTTLYILAACILLSMGQERKPFTHAIVIGILLGLATLARPVGLFGTLPIFIGMLFVSSERLLSAVRERLPYAALALLVFLSCLLPWSYRNYTRTGEFSVSSLPAYNFVYYNMPLFLSFWNGTPEEEERARILAPFENPEDTLVLRSAFHASALEEIMSEFIREHSLPYAAYHAYKMIPFFLGSGFNVAHSIVVIEAPSLRLSFFPTLQQNLTSEALAGNWKAVLLNLKTFWLVTVERILWLLTFGLAFISPLFARGNTRKFLLLSLFIILLTAFLSSPVVQPRYRFPAEPFIWLTAVYSVYALRAMYTQKWSIFAKQPRA